MKSKNLSIIIVNYNGEKFLKNCIDSIYENCTSEDFEIIIVDNNSSDNSISIIKEFYPNCILIESKENLGFAKGNNLGVKNCNGKFVLLLNNDTILINDITDSISILEEDKEIGLLGIKMLDKDLNYEKSAGKFPKLLSLLFFSELFINTKNFLSGDFSKELIEVDWIQGSFLLTRKSLYSKVKGLDEDYFMYVEDVDFCKKIAKLDKKRVYYSKQSYVHFGGFNSSRKHLLIDGYTMYVEKHFIKYKLIAFFLLKVKRLLIKK
mgnify:FL=1